MKKLLLMLTSGLAFVLFSCAPTGLTMNNLGSKAPRTPIKELTRWSGRAGHQAVVYQDELYVLGGRGYDKKSHIVYLNDVWKSSDGENWTQLEDAPWSPRSEHQAVVFQDKLYVLGGYENLAGGLSYYSDVWVYDGSDWSEVYNNDATPWSGRERFQAVVFNDGRGEKLYVIGGTGNVHFKDIWTYDGNSWRELPSSAVPFSHLYGHQAVVFQPKATKSDPLMDSIFVLGSEKHPRHEVWRSDRNSGFIKISDSLPGHPSIYPSGRRATVFKEEIYTIAKKSQSSPEPMSMWKSADGITWDTVTDTLPIKGLARFSYQMISFKDKIYFLGGYEYDNGLEYQNEVWTYGSSGHWKEVSPSVNEATRFPERYSHSMISFQASGEETEALYVLGGWGFNDVWKSTDGQVWEEVLNTTPWGKRNQRAAVFQGDIYLLYSRHNYPDELWKSSNGLDWIQLPSLSNSMGISVSAIGPPIVFKEALYVMMQDVEGTSGVRWMKSSDGLTWQTVSTTSLWRIYHTRMVVATENGQPMLYALGGYYNNNVWKSTDGANWVQASTPQWSQRYRHQAVVFKHDIYILGGYNGTSLNDVWVDDYWAGWTQLTAQAPWPGRYSHQAVVFNAGDGEAIYLAGGTNSSIWFNDVWKSTDGTNWLELPILE